VSSIALAPLVLLWMLIGVALAGIHLWMLRCALQRVEPLEPSRAGVRLATGMPLRLLAVAPILALAARAGLGACLGLVAGSLAGRWLGVWYLRGRLSLPIRCQKQG